MSANPPDDHALAQLTPAELPVACGVEELLREARRLEADWRQHQVCPDEFAQD